VGKSFVLKDGMGRPAGYLTQGLSAIKCRALDMKEVMKAVLLYDDGSFSERAIEPGLTEREWQNETKAVIGVVILRGEEIAADSGQEARRRYEQTRSKKAKDTKNTKNLSGAADPPLEQEEEKTERIEEINAGSAREAILPERRWPPPPCWKEAVYRMGAWSQEHQ